MKKDSKKNYMISTLKNSGYISKLLVGIWTCLVSLTTIGCFLQITSDSLISDLTLLGFACLLFTAALFIPAYTIAQGKEAKNNNALNSYRSWISTLLLSVFLGFVGAHRFFTGRYLTAIIYLFTLGGGGIGWALDILLILFGHFTDNYGHIIRRRVKSHRPSSPIPPVPLILTTPIIQKTQHSKVEPTHNTNALTEDTSEDSNIPPVHSQEVTTDAISETSNTPLPQITPLPSTANNNFIFTEVIIGDSEETFETIPQKVEETEEVNFDETNLYLSYSSYPSKQKFFNDMKNYLKRKEPPVPFVPFMDYWPTYDSMSKEQELWYFYWRNEVRNHRYPNTDLSYIFIHVYELLSGYGWEMPHNGFSQLLTLWLSYRERHPKLDNYLYDWLFDFSQIHNILFEIPDEIPRQLPKQLAAQDILISSHADEKPLKLSLIEIDALCDYSIVNSKFYKGGNQLLMDEAIPRVIALADAALLKKKGKGILDIYGPNRPRKQRLYLFQSAVCPDANKHMDISVKAYTSSQKLRNYINTLVRYAESTLRSMYGYRGRLHGVNLDEDTAALIDAFLKKEYSPNKRKKETPAAKIEVKLDVANIENLRKQSDAVRDALEVAEDNAETQTIPLSDLQEVRNMFEAVSSESKDFLYSLYKANWKLPVTPDFSLLAEEINKFANMHIACSLIFEERNHFTAEDDFRDELEHILSSHQTSPVSETNIPSEQNTEDDSYFIASLLPENMNQLISSLSSVSLKVLCIVLAENDVHERLTQIADEEMSMPEILLDEINDAAYTYIDDILIDTFGDTPFVLEQYSPDLKAAMIRR